MKTSLRRVIFNQEIKGKALQSRSRFQHAQVLIDEEGAAQVEETLKELFS